MDRNPNDLFGAYPYSQQGLNSYGSYSGQSPRYNQMPQYSNPYTPQFQTNKILVTGPEEALMRANQQNCLFVCFNQNKPEMYEVRVDTEGRKKIDTYYLTTTLTNNNNDYEARLKRLEDRVFEPASDGGIENASAK